MEIDDRLDFYPDPDDGVPVRVKVWHDGNYFWVHNPHPCPVEIVITTEMNGVPIRSTTDVCRVIQPNDRVALSTQAIVCCHRMIPALRDIARNIRLRAEVYLPHLGGVLNEVLRSSCLYPAPAASAAALSN